jgi:arsenite methyltransferase
VTADRASCSGTGLPTRPPHGIVADMTDGPSPTPGTRAAAPAASPTQFGPALITHLEHMYASPQAVAQRKRFRQLVAARPGETGVDIGCGLAHLSSELAGDVAPNGRIVGIDSSADMLAAAQRRVASQGLTASVELRAGDATRLDLPDAIADFAVVVQVYSYVPDVAAAIVEAARVLRPGGRLAILDTDWDQCVYASADDARTRRMIDGRWRFAHPHLPRQLHGLLRAAGLTLRTCEAFPIVETRYDPDSFGASLTEVCRNAAVRHGVDAGDADAWVADIRSRSGDGEYFFSVNRTMFVADK